MYGILSVLTVVFHAIGAFLAFIYVRLHVQIRPIQKHPGPLIYHQILILGLFSTLNTLCLIVKLLASTVSLSEEVIEISSKIQVALEFYSTVNLMSYQIFIGTEVLVKSLFSYLRKWYKLRVKLYHYVAHLTAMISLGIFAQDFIEGVNYVKYIVHAIIPGSLVILSCVFIYGTQCSLDNLENSPKKRFCDDITSHLKTVLYMKSFWILSCFIKQAYDESDKEAYIKLKIGVYVFYYFFEWGSLIIIMLARLGQTHTWSYLKDSIRKAKRPSIRRSRYKQHTEIDETSSAENSMQNGKLGNLVVDTENKILLLPKGRASGYTVLRLGSTGDSYFKAEMFYCEYSSYLSYIFNDILLMDNLSSKEISASFRVSSNNDVISSYREASMSNLSLFTYDKRFILQSISQAEKKFFLENMIEHFHRRVMNKSLVQHIYGIYKLTLRGQMFRYLVLDNPMYTIPNSVVLTAEWTQIYPEYYSIDSTNLNAVIRYFENILEAEISININALHKLSSSLIDDLEFINQLKLQNFSVTFAYSKWSEEEDDSNKIVGTVGDQKSFIIFSLSNLLRHFPKSDTATAYGSFRTNHEQHLYTF